MLQVRSDRGVVISVYLGRRQRWYPVSPRKDLISFLVLGIQTRVQQWPWLCLAISVCGPPCGQDINILILGIEMFDLMVKLAPVSLSWFLVWRRWSSQVELNITTSFIYTETCEERLPTNMFIRRWKVAGAPTKPKGNTKNWYFTKVVVNAAFLQEPSATGTYQYPIVRSSVVMNLAHEAIQQVLHTGHGKGSWVDHCI